MENADLISEGKLPGHGYFQAYGRNPEIDKNIEDLWNGDGIYPFIDNPCKHFVHSDSPIDTSANGGGLHNIRLLGLNDKKQWCVEEIKLEGLSRVETKNKYFRTFVAEGIHGTDTINANDGNIFIKDTEEDKVRLVISKNMGRSEAAVFTVPRGYKGFIRSNWVNMARSGPSSVVSAYIKIRPKGEVFRIMEPIGLMPQGTTYLPRGHEIPYNIPELTDIKMQVTGDKNTDVRGGFLVVYKRMEE
jgi:hypothetical protein